MISIKQLIGNDLDQQQTMMRSHQAGLQTAMPGIITAFDHIKMTCSVQPAIQGIKFGANGSTPLNLPILVDCPIVFPRGTNCSITFPITLGQECLVIFSSRCIDSWWQLGAMQSGKVTPRPPLEMRMHDLSDGFVLAGPYSQTNLIPNVSTTSVEIRTNDGQAKIGLNVSDHSISISTTSSVNINSTGNTTITAPLTQINGDVNCSGTITASTDVIGGGKSLKSHTHPDPQGSSTGAPN